jgi:hypothetical protein
MLERFDKGFLSVSNYTRRPSIPLLFRPGQIVALLAAHSPRLPAITS